MRASDGTWGPTITKSYWKFGGTGYVPDTIVYSEVDEASATASAQLRFEAEDGAFDSIWEIMESDRFLGGLSSGFLLTTTRLSHRMAKSKRVPQSYIIADGDSDGIIDELDDDSDNDGISNGDEQPSEPIPSWLIPTVMAST